MKRFKKNYYKEKFLRFGKYEYWWWRFPRLGGKNIRNLRNWTRDRETYYGSACKWDHYRNESLQLKKTSLLGTELGPSLRFIKSRLWGERKTSRRLAPFWSQFITCTISAQELNPAGGGIWKFPAGLLLVWKRAEEVRHYRHRWQPRWNFRSIRTAPSFEPRR